MVVDLYHSGQSVRDLSHEYGVSTCIKKLSPMELEEGSSVTPEDYAKLKKQMLKPQQENEILKKATVIKVTDDEITADSNIHCAKC